MAAAQTPPGRAEPVERFRPTSGRVLGYTSLVVIAGLVVFIAVGVHTITGLRIATGLLFAGVAVWVTQLRPRATAYPDVLHLQNSLRDSTVPLAAIDEVSVRRMLSVWVGEQQYVCIGIGTPLRRLVKGGSRGPSSLLGFDRLEDYTERSTPLAPDQSAMTYPEFVELKITDLVRDAKRSAGPDAPAASRPRHSWAWPEIIALAGTGLAFVLTLVL